MSRQLSYLLLALPLAWVAAPAQVSPWDLLMKARSTSTLHQDSSPSFHLKASFHTFDEKGQPNGDGTVDELYEKGGNWRRNLVYNGKQSLAVHRAHEKTEFRTDTGFDHTFAEVEILDALSMPIQVDEKLATSKLETQTVKLGTVDLTCVIVSLPVPSEWNSKATAPNKAYCIDPSTGLLRAVRAHDGFVITWNTFSRIGTTYFARDINFSERDKRRATLHIDMLEASPLFPADAFSPISGTANDPAQATKIPSMTMGRKLSGERPVYPRDAAARHVQGTVVLRAYIGTDGRIRDLELVSAPDDSLVDSAIEAVRTWTYSPYLVDGKPIKVETTITVNYAMP